MDCVIPNSSISSHCLWHHKTTFLNVGAQCLQDTMGLKLEPVKRRKQNSRVTEVLVCTPFELIFNVKVNRVALHLVSASLSDQCPEGLVEHSSSQYCQGNVHAEWI